jgi:hypothetical protein
MWGVEEYDAPTASTSRSKAATFAKIFSLALALTLLMVSVYSMNLITSTQATGAGFSNMPLALAQNQTFSCPLNFTQKEGPILSAASSSGIIVNDPKFAGSMNEWVEYYPHLDIEINQTYSLEFHHTYLNITVRDSKGNAISWGQWGVDSAIGFSSGGLGAIINRPDSYKLEVRNLGPDWLYANIGVHISGQYFQKPLFYYGLGGLIVTSSYLVVFFAGLGWTRRRNALNHTE